jgi:hypothetical protein
VATTCFPLPIDGAGAENSQDVRRTTESIDDDALLLCSVTVLIHRRNKAYLPSVVYTIGAGPFSRSLVRLGYDPSANSSSAM